MRKNFPAIDMPQPKEFERGGIVGVAEIIDCVTSTRSAWFFGPVGYILAHARPLPFLRVKGALGFFKVDYDYDFIAQEWRQENDGSKNLPAASENIR